MNDASCAPVDVLIVGGGLAGLSLADRLRGTGKSITLIEARDRLGGRILGEAPGLDLGPAWFWPGQPRMAALVADLGLAAFEQFAVGDALHEDATGQVFRTGGQGGMAGSLRVAGGLGRVVDRLSARVPEGVLQREVRVVAVHRGPAGIEAETADGRRISARRIVLALPPRIAARIRFDPPLSALGAMAAVPTWMAGQAKAVVSYDRPFWREAGLSGDAFSRRGPMVEIHDASGPDGTPAALFGFIGVPAAARQDREGLRAAVLAQVVRLFGSEAASPRALHLKDWAFDPMTATQADQAPLRQHPAYGPVPGAETVWDGTVILGGSEVAPRFGGYLEGALEAAEAVAARLMAPLP